LGDGLVIAIAAMSGGGAAGDADDLAIAAMRGRVAAGDGGRPCKSWRCWLGLEMAMARDEFSRAGDDD